MASPIRNLSVFQALPLPSWAEAHAASARAPERKLPPEALKAFAVVPDHLKGEAVNGAGNELGAGIDPDAYKPKYPPMDEAALNACLDAIPNPPNTDYNRWNTIGMRVYCACEAADYGLKAWKRWSAKHPTGDGDCDAKWAQHHQSPPTRTGAGALIKEARAALNDPKWRPPLARVTHRVTSTAEPSFADPWAEFVGPPFPLHILPSTLAAFVAAQHQAMGADPAALAMAVVTAAAGAIHAETKIKMGEGWTEPPILWTALIGPPSAMKSPIIQKATAPLRKIDHNHDAIWRQQRSVWEAAGKQGAPPPKPARSVIQDATPEKVAEILSRAPAGSLMVHDELAGWLGSFERYNSGAASRAFFLQCWNGGPFLKDRVGAGVRDQYAEIRVENLALCVLGGIQPDRLAELRDLTSDGLLQRLLPVLMRAPERGNESHPVSAAESDYEKLIGSLHCAPPHAYDFEPNAIKVRKRVLDRLFDLEQSLDGFSSALIGAIGKLKGYYGRLALVMHVTAEHIALQGNAHRAGKPIPLHRRGSGAAALRVLTSPHLWPL